MFKILQCPILISRQNFKFWILSKKPLLPTFSNLPLIVPPTHLTKQAYFIFLIILHLASPFCCYTCELCYLEYSSPGLTFFYNEFETGFELLYLYRRKKIMTAVLVTVYNIKIRVANLLNFSIDQDHENHFVCINLFISNIALRWVILLSSYYE
jgi:hypothetical protein